MRFVGGQSSTRFGERSCLWEMRQRTKERDTQSPPLTSMHAQESVHHPSCTHAHTPYTYTTHIYSCTVSK